MHVHSVNSCNNLASSYRCACYMHLLNLRYINYYVVYLSIYICMVPRFLSFLRVSSVFIIIFRSLVTYFLTYFWSALEVDSL